MEVENKPQPMAGFAVGILSPGKRTNQVRYILKKILSPGKRTNQVCFVQCNLVLESGNALLLCTIILFIPHLLEWLQNQCQ